MLAWGLWAIPALLFLDEPTTGLDPAGRRTSWELVRTLAGEGTTVILTTHYMEEAEALADQVAIIASGKIVAHGPPGVVRGPRPGCGHDPLPATRRRHARRSARGGRRSMGGPSSCGPTVSSRHCTS